MLDSFGRQAVRLAPEREPDMGVCVIPRLCRGFLVGGDICWGDLETGLVRAGGCQQPTTKQGGGDHEHASKKPQETPDLQRTAGVDLSGYV